MRPDIIKSLSIKSEKLVLKWNKTFQQRVSEYIQGHASVFEGIYKNIEELKNKNENATAADFYEFHTNNLILLKSLYTTLKPKSESNEFLEMVTSGLTKDVDSLEARIDDFFNTGFDYTGGRIGSSRFLYKTGNLFYHFCSIPIYIRNIYAKIFRKPLKPLRQRQHTIYFRNIIKGFLMDEYIVNARESIFEIQKKVAKLAFNLFEIESTLINTNYSFENVTVEPISFDDLYLELSKIELFFDNYKPILITLLEKSGTWEFPGLYIRYKKKFNYKNICERVDSTYKLWDSTFYALYEDWRFREGLFSFISTIKKQQSDTLKIYSDKLERTINPVIIGKKAYLEQLLKQIPEPEAIDDSSLKHFFSSEVYKLRKEVNKQNIVVDFNKTSSEIEKILIKIELDIEEALKKMPVKSGVVRSPDYEKGIRKSDIYFFSPQEFVDYKFTPLFIKNIQSASEDFKDNFRGLINEISDFDQIIDFSLDMAISMLNSQNTQDETVFMFKEGMKRSLNILEHITKISENLLQTKEKELAGFYVHFINNIKNLDNNDSILGIYSSLLKSKAINESIKKRKRIFLHLSHSISVLGAFFRKQVDVVVTVNASIRKKLKLENAPVFVSSEISNYLSQINKRIYNLPVIYRYLFENAPVKEINLFLSRQQEVEKIDSALKDWKAGNYAATLIIGENGSGKSSLLYHYLQTAKGSYKVYNFTIKRFYYSDDDFYLLMQEVFDNNNLKTEQDLIEHLDLAEGKQIIVLDGLERTFIRKPGGFKCIQKLLSFIVSTNSQAFWICSVSLHACNYLNKTISIKENFDYLVELNNLDSNEIRKIILKRHRLSGYIVQYEGDLNIKENNKKTKDRQIQLEKEYFEELNRFADSNLSLSFYFWLESISEFSDKELYIKKFVSPDFAFLETLSVEKIYTLLLIVLHGKISVDLHASVCNQSTQKSLKVLTILKEDSIIVLKGEHYMLNGILYRHVIQLLKNKNLIH